MKGFSFFRNFRRPKDSLPREMSRETSLDYILKSYGDTLFDLCESLLANPTAAQIAFRAILKKTRLTRKNLRYAEFERSWVLKIACGQLIKFYENYGFRVSLQEQIRLNDHTNISAKLKQFTLYFRRLTAEDQILLLLKDKYDIPHEDISSALSVPAGSLKVRRQQALRALEEWLWNSR